MSWFESSDFYIQIGILCIHFCLFVIVSINLLTSQRDEPRSIMLWLITVMLLPIIGTIGYFLFGYKSKWIIRHRVKNALYKLRKMNLKYERVHPYSEGKHESVYNRMLNNMKHREYRRAKNNIKLLHDGTEAYPRMLDAIRNAKHHIHLQSYIISNDNFTREVFDLLVQKANEGVQVRVIYDLLGSLWAFSTFFFLRYSKRSPNLTIRAFSYGMMATPWRIQRRNHRKLLVVDGQISFVGGLNLAAENKKQKRIKPQIKDLHTEIRGPVVNDMQFQFFRDWFFSGGEDEISEEAQNAYFPQIPPSGTSIIRLMGSGPGQHEHGIENLFHTMLATATSHVWIMTPYFIPDITFIHAIRMARLRGVEVRLIIPKRADNFVTTNAAKVLYPTLLSCGARIYEKSGRFMHSKAMIVDNHIVVMGSANCDVRSFYLNYETAFVVECEIFNRHLRTHFREEIKKSHEIFIDEIKNKSWTRKMMESICYLFAPVL